MTGSRELRLKELIDGAWLRGCYDDGIYCSIQLASRTIPASMTMPTSLGLCRLRCLVLSFAAAFIGGNTALAFDKSDNLGVAVAPPSVSYPFRIEALCSLYSKYEVCHPILTESSISANFPTEFLELTSKDIKSIVIYDSRRKETNYVVGAASTILFGPYGLIGFLATRNVGDVDFGFAYFDNGRKRTAYVRFKNNNSTKAFGEALKPLVQLLDKSQTGPTP